MSIGLLSANLARDPNAYLGQIAHEYFHTWNEVHLRPAAWIGLRHVAPAPTGELWFSEGVTLYYADLLLRRAGLHTPDSTRVARLERLMATYLANPSHGMVSPEQTSRAFNLQAATGDYTPSMFTQGELLGAVLDLMIRDGWCPTCGCRRISFPVSSPRLQIWFPETVWGRAGLHTGDRIVSWNGVAITDPQQLRAALAQLHIGDTVRVAVLRDARRFETTVAMSGYNRPIVRIDEPPEATDAQRRLRTRWLAGQ